MHDRRTEIEARLARALAERVLPAVLTPVADLDLEVWHVPPGPDGHVGEPVPFEDALAATYEPAGVGDPWGPAWGTSWFRVSGTVPDGLEDKARLAVANCPEFAIALLDSGEVTGAADAPGSSIGRSS